MKIDFKTQTNRSTKFNTGFNNVNLCLGKFEVGLETTKWGNSQEIEHKITFEIEEHNYSIPLNLFIKNFKNKIKLLDKQYWEKEK